MKKIGLIGGMSWKSSIEYYRIINDEVRLRLGGLHSAKVIIDSLNFSEIVDLQKKNDWEGAAQCLSNCAIGLQNAGAQMVLICTNTMHKVAPEVQLKIKVPLIHIGDCVAKSVLRKGFKKIGLLGTCYTMEQDFLKDRMMSHGLEVIVPYEKQRKIIHNVIFDELAVGVVSDDSRMSYKKIIDSLKEQGAQAIVLGCTEIMLLIKQKDSCLPIFDTTREHCLEAVQQALS